MPNDWLTEHLTLEDAVTHRTGLPRHDSSWYVEKNGKPVSAKDVVRNIRNLPVPPVEPRTEFHYNNLMFVTLQHVVETLTGRPLKHVINETIWGPLGMTTTYLDLEEAKQSPSHLADSYTWHEETGEFEKMPFFDAVGAGGAGGVISSVMDYTKWLNCLIHETDPLSKQVHKEIRKPRMIMKAQPDAFSDVDIYGLGWWRQIIHGHVAYQHTGSTATYGANVYWFPNLKYGIVAFANSNGLSGEVNRIVVQRLIEDRLGVSEEDRVDADGM